MKIKWWKNPSNDQWKHKMIMDLELLAVHVLCPAITVAFFLCLLILFFKLCSQCWRMWRNHDDQEDQGSNNMINGHDHDHHHHHHHHGNHELVGVSIYYPPRADNQERVHPNNMELFLRLREGLSRNNPTRVMRQQRHQTLKSLPPPEDYDSYKKTMIISSTECAICLEEFHSGDLCRVLPLCKHIYHFRCINRWLMDDLTCPICRTSVWSKTNIDLNL